MCLCWMMDDLLVWKGSMCQCPPPGLGAIFSVVNDQAFHSLDIPTHRPPPHLRHLSPPPPPQRPDSPPPQNPRTPPPPSSVSSRQPPPPAWSPQPRCCSDYCLLDKEDMDKGKVDKEDLLLCSPGCSRRRRRPCCSRCSWSSRLERRLLARERSARGREQPVMGLRSALHQHCAMNIDFMN